jgi:hypothetical protein
MARLAVNSTSSLRPRRRRNAQTPGWFLTNAIESCRRRSARVAAASRPAFRPFMAMTSPAHLLPGPNTRHFNQSGAGGKQRCCSFQHNRPPQPKLRLRNGPRTLADRKPRACLGRPDQGVLLCEICRRAPPTFCAEGARNYTSHHARQKSANKGRPRNLVLNTDTHATSSDHGIALPAADQQAPKNAAAAFLGLPSLIRCPPSASIPR